MTRINLQLPPSIHARAKKFAKQDGVSLDHLITLALAEKMAALDGQEYLRLRAARGSRAKFERAMAKVGAKKPVKGDELPKR